MKQSKEECWVKRFFESLFSCTSLHISSQKLRYRNKITYNLPLTATSDLAQDLLNNVSQEIQNWTDSQSTIIFDECMVKVTRKGSLLVRVTVQQRNDNDLSIDLVPFRHYLQNQYPALECLCFNVAENSMRPTKDAPIHFLTPSKFVLERTPCDLEYRIGPDTFSEVNHTVERLQYNQTKRWLQQFVPVSDDSSHSNMVLIASGRDVSSFALCFGTLPQQTHKKSHDHTDGVDHTVGSEEARMFSHVVAIQHCPLVHRDAVANCARHSSKLNATVRHQTKVDMVDGFATELKRFPDSTIVGVMTGGRHGLDPSYITYLCENIQVKCIIYNSCSTKSLLRDMQGFLNGGFFVEDFKSYDFLPGTGYTASLTKLIRRPRTLIIPVGPAGCGKSTLARRLMHHSPVRWWQRDLVFVSLREQGLGVNKSGKLCHEDLLSFLRERVDSNSVLFVDSTNGNSEARSLYVNEARAGLVILVVLKPPTENEMHFLLQRTANRLGENKACHPSFPTTVTEQREKHEKILKGMEYPRTSDEDLFEGISSTVRVLRCDLGDQEEVLNLGYTVFLHYSAQDRLRRIAMPSFCSGSTVQEGC